MCRLQFITPHVHPWIQKEARGLGGKDIVLLQIQVTETEGEKIPAIDTIAIFTEEPRAEASERLPLLTRLSLDSEDGFRTGCRNVSR